MRNHYDLEELLSNDNNNLSTVEITNERSDSKKRDQLKANKSATMFDFIEMIDKIVTLTMKDLNVKFIPDEGKIVYLANDLKLEFPIIAYKVKERKTKKEIKPRLRENFVEDKNDPTSRVGEIYGQKFICHLQFNIFASEYKMAEEIMSRFEEMMIIYAGYFKQNGVAELFFDNQYTDDSFKSIRQTLSVRNICYYVEIEKLTVIMKEVIKEIDIY